MACRQACQTDVTFADRILITFPPRQRTCTEFHSQMHDEVCQSRLNISQILFAVDEV